MVKPGHDKCSDGWTNQALTTEKIKVVLLTRRRILRKSKMMEDMEIISTKILVKYHGLRPERKMTFREQIRSSNDKPAKVITMLRMLLSNVGRSTKSKRQLLMAVTHSILLYESEIWSDALQQANSCSTATRNSQSRQHRTGNSNGPTGPGK